MQLLRSLSRLLLDHPSWNAARGTVQQTAARNDITFVVVVVNAVVVTLLASGWLTVVAADLAVVVRFLGGCHCRETTYKSGWSRS